MIRTRRRLQEARDVPLFLSLYYLNHEGAAELESMDPSNPVVAHLCQSINTQVRRSFLRSSKRPQNSDDTRAKFSFRLFLVSHVSTGKWTAGSRSGR